jgi:hypothetical protein
MCIRQSEAVQGSPLRQSEAVQGSPTIIPINLRQSEAVQGSPLRQSEVVQGSPTMFPNRLIVINRLQHQIRQDTSEIACLLLPPFYWLHSM